MERDVASSFCSRGISENTLITLPADEWNTLREKKKKKKHNCVAYLDPYIVRGHKTTTLSMWWDIRNTQRSYACCSFPNNLSSLPSNLSAKPRVISGPKETFLYKQAPNTISAQPHAETDFKGKKLIQKNMNKCFVLGGGGTRQQHESGWVIKEVNEVYTCSQQHFI